MLLVLIDDCILCFDRDMLNVVELVVIFCQSFHRTGGYYGIAMSEHRKVVSAVVHMDTNWLFA